MRHKPQEIDKKACFPVRKQLLRVEAGRIWNSRPAMHPRCRLHVVVKLFCGSLASPKNDGFPFSLPRALPDRLLDFANIKFV